MFPALLIDGTRSDMLLIADHASNLVPPGIDLGIAPELLEQHIAVDIGVSCCAPCLAARRCWAAYLGW